MNLDSGIALISLAEAKEYLNVAGSSSEDAVINAILNGASAWAAGYLRRNLLRTTYTEYYDGDGGDELILRNRPIQSLTSLYVDSLRQWASTSAVDIATSVIIRKNAGILQLFNTISSFAEGTANVKVVYVAGYYAASTTTEAAGGMPNAIRLAVKRILDHQYRTGYTHRKLDVRSESVGDMNTTYSDADIPGDAKAMLAPFRDVVTPPRFSYAD